MTDDVKKSIKKPPGIPWKKGKPGGPGRPKDPPELHTIKRMTKAELELLMHKIMHLSEKELEDFKGTAIEMSMAAIIKKSITYGDNQRVNFFLERLFGKVPTKLEHSGSIDSNPKTIEEVDAQLVRLDAEIYSRSKA
jgi:hypothetical protein